jgi:glyoxylase-like metal-dependent hydrolase (beta-lactamase superfamily II)
VHVIRYHGTNAYFLPIADRLLAIDCGWPCSLPEYRRLMKEQGLSFQNLRRAIVTHLHMDHAGLLGEFQRVGIECFLIGQQDEAASAEMERVIEKNRDYAGYVPIEFNRIQRLALDEFNAVAPTWGTAVEAVATPSHSRDSVSFLIEQEAVVGDLAPRNQILDDDPAHVDWRLLAARGTVRAYPGHAAPFRL